MIRNVSVTSDDGRAGERRARRWLVLAAGTVALSACLVVAGAAGASVYAASGRLILGWFAARERGLAMGIRQSAQPLGVAVAALTPPLVAVLIGAAGYPAAFAVAGVLPLAAAVLVPLAAEHRAPPRAEAAPAAQAR
jgi:sugar phosphate permease